MITIKNIIFDLGGVILKDQPISALKKFNINENDYNELKKFFVDWSDLDLGNELLEDKYNKCHFPIIYDKLYKDKLINYYKYREINVEILNLINKLKQNDYRIYVLSDINKDSFNYYKNNHAFKNIDGWVVSCEYNTEKKDGVLIDILINKYNLNAFECYFIDNNPNIIKEAYKHGIKGYLYDENNNIDYLYNDLKNNGFDI